MRIANISGRELVLENLTSTLRTDAIRELIELIGQKRGFLKVQTEELLSEVLRRHEKSPCGLGRGLAFPNARTDSISIPCLALGFSKRGLDFGGKDGRLAHVILVYLGRSSASEEERSMLGRLSKALANPAFAERLVFSENALEAWEILASIDQEAAVELRGGKS